MECVVLGNLFVGVDTKRPPRFFIHVDIVPLASPLVDIDTRPSVGADGIDEALSGAFAHAEAASEFSTETSSAAAARFGLGDECQRRVQPGVVGVRVRLAGAGAGADGAAGGVAQRAAVGVVPDGAPVPVAA